jgi:hypothetical protein
MRRSLCIAVRAGVLYAQSLALFEHSSDRLGVTRCLEGAGILRRAVSWWPRESRGTCST